MASNPRAPQHRDVPAQKQQQRGKPASPLVPLRILVAAFILMAIIVWLSRAPKLSTAPLNATVPAQPTGDQVRLSNLRISDAPLVGQMYIYARLTNGTTAINGVRLNVTFTGQNEKLVDTITTNVESFQSGKEESLVNDPIRPSQSRDVHIPLERNHRMPEIKVQDVTGFGTR